MFLPLRCVSIRTQAGVRRSGKLKRWRWIAISGPDSKCLTINTVSTEPAGVVPWINSIEFLHCRQARIPVCLQTFSWPVFQRIEFYIKLVNLLVSHMHTTGPHLDGSKCVCMCRSAIGYSYWPKQLSTSISMWVNFYYYLYPDLE